MYMLISVNNTNINSNIKHICPNDTKLYRLKSCQQFLYYQLFYNKVIKGQTLVQNIYNSPWR